MFGTLLIANRGEIARRIIRTARRLGMNSVAVHSTADAGMPFVREADAALEIASYLDGTAILEAARAAGAEAVHPGYGFLSENADFAEAVGAAGLAWVGAPPAAIRAMGLKDAAKALMAAAGVPVTPGYHGADQSDARLRAEAEAIGMPVLIKAVAGGGGKGMRKVERIADFDAALASCRREAAAAFGDERVLIEKYIERPRHIEVQLFGDTHGNVVHLFERDCSLQRRHQKVIEEAPAPGMDDATRAAICAAAVRAAKAVDYVGAGTVEFIADASAGLRADRIWFMEMNTRLQVEHPVTEAITGLDLVEWQLRVAAGETLPLAQDEIHMTGWAMEARLYAETPANGFLPATGRIDHLRLPDTVRIDSGVEAGCAIGPDYDPMIAKLVAHAPTREAAATRLATACRAVEIAPLRCNAAFLARAAADSDFVAGEIDTGFIARHLDRLLPSAEPTETVIRAAAAAILPPPGSDPWTALRGWRGAGPAETRVAVEIDGVAHVAPDASPGATASGHVFVEGAAHAVALPAAGHRSEGNVADGTITAPMPGRVIALDVAVGESVVAGQRLAVIEAMKMEQALLAPFDGLVAALRVSAGAQVSEGQILVEIAGRDEA